MVSMLLLLAGCATTGQLSEKQVLAIGEPVLKATFPETFDGNKPYHAVFTNGIWWIHGTLPLNTLGGTPEALVDDRSGNILKIYHTQ